VVVVVGWLRTRRYSRTSPTCPRFRRRPSSATCTASRACRTSSFTSTTTPCSVRLCGPTTSTLPARAKRSTLLSSLLPPRPSNVHLCRRLGLAYLELGRCTWRGPCPTVLRAVRPHGSVMATATGSLSPHPPPIFHENAQCRGCVAGWLWGRCLT
jgi:hypothetical protein